MIPKTTTVVLQLFVLLVALPAVALAQQPPYDVFPPADPPYYRVRYEASTQPGGLVFSVNYVVWIPKDVKTLRGVVVHQHGCGEGSCKSGLTGAYDLHWQALAKKHDCALLAPAYEQPEKADCQMWCDPRNGSDEAFRKCLVDLGAKSGHAELADVPWALWGHSGGGHWAGGMVLLHPQRVAAAWLRSGVPLLKADPAKTGIKAHTLPDAALKVPMLCNLGTKEGVTVKDDRFAGVWPANEAFFNEVRAKGGLVGVAVDPLSSHDCGNQRYLAIPWLDACLSARLPKTNGEPLRDMPVDQSWLAEPTGAEALPAAKFGGDPLKAAWLPSEPMARAWMEYVKDTKVTDATPPPAPTNLRVKGNELSWDVEADLESGLASFVIERDGQFLANVPEKGSNPFGRPVFQNLQYSDTPPQPLASMRYTDTTAKPGDKHDYRVIAVNTVGLKSKPSENLVAGAAPDGTQIFKAKCAICHGAEGQGTAKHKRRLEGDRSLLQLAELIHKTMPEDDPETLTAAEAQAVAAFVHDVFYSAVARERNRAARVELARLTARQHRQAVADVIGGFREPAKWPPERGLAGEYTQGRGFGRRGGRGGNEAIQRTDAQIKFDFGTEAPVPEIAEPHEFSIRWNGSVLAPEAGEYEFVVRTEHAIRLWINDMNHPLIDAWVKSGSDTEFRATQFLLAGHPYRLRLEFTKAKQGVDDSKNKKEKPPSKPASIALLWKRPQGALEPIPASQLSPGPVPESYVAATPFPPDDRSYGWERGTAVSKEWVEATTNAALEAAGYVDSHLDDLSRSRENDSDRAAKLRVFCRAFAERAFRRPLTDEQAAQLIDHHFAAVADPRTAVKRFVLLVLKSPRFLYREIEPAADGYDVASRLSFGMWDSIPDQELLSAAAAGKLSTKEEVSRQAERMLTDLRARSKLHEFLLKWLKADLPIDLAKDGGKFPGFDSAVIGDLRESLELFLDDVLWSERSDFRQLLEADYVFLNDRLAKFYGADLPAAGETAPGETAPGETAPGETAPGTPRDTGAEFTRVKLDGDAQGDARGNVRAGVLTHPYLMARFAHSSESSPIHRGVFLARGVLGHAMRPPPEAVAPLPPDLNPDLTTRERVDLQTRPAACMTCHAVINPLGFTLENFDAVGRFRNVDRGKPVDASGTYRTHAGETININGARELAAMLAHSDDAQGAFVEQLFHHLVQQPVRAYGPTTLDDLKREFCAQDMNIRKLAVAIMAHSALKGR